MWGAKRFTVSEHWRWLAASERSRVRERNWLALVQVAGRSVNVNDDGTNPRLEVQIAWVELRDIL